MKYIDTPVKHCTAARLSGEIADKEGARRDGRRAGPDLTRSLSGVKQAILGFFLSIIATFASVAASVTLEWDANTEQDLSGYRLHVGTSTGTYSASQDVGNVTRATIPNLEAGQTYYIAVTAYNTAGLESAPSNEVTVRAEARLPKVQPTGIGYDSGSIELKLIGDPGDSYHVWYSDDLIDWSLLASVENVEGTVLVTDNEVGEVRKRFYRVSLAE